MKKNSQIIQDLHAKAVTLTSQMRSIELELIEILKSLDTMRGYRELGYKNLHDYATLGLKLSEAVAYTMITLARKTREIPQLQEKLESHAIPITQARMIAPLLTSENQEVWIKKAETLSKRELEKEIKKQFPEKAVQEKVRPVASNRHELRVGISDALFEKLKRVQDLECQKTGKAVSLEYALEAMADLYLEKKDPVNKAERIVTKGSSTARHVVQKQEAQASTTRHMVQKIVVPGKILQKTASLNAQHTMRFTSIARHAMRLNRKPIPAKIKHAVFMRDQGKCVHVEINGKICKSSKWVDIHHVKSVSEGGVNELSNLQTLCRDHHRLIHELAQT